MAHRHTPKQHKTFAAGAAVLVTAAILGAPALAATSNSIPCGEISEATLEVSAIALISEMVSHEIPTVPRNSEAPVDDIESVSSASLLAPRAEAAIRDAFKESERSKETLSAVTAKARFGKSTLPMAGFDSKPQREVNSETQTVPVRDMNTKLPGVSDVASSRYKKQMFRRDI